MSYVYGFEQVVAVQPVPVPLFCVTVYDALPPPGIVAVELWRPVANVAAVFGADPVLTVPKMAWPSMKRKNPWVSGETYNGLREERLFVWRFDDEGFACPVATGTTNETLTDAVALLVGEVV